MIGPALALMNTLFQITENSTLVKVNSFTGIFFRILSTFSNTYFKEHSSGCFRHTFVYYFVVEIKKNVRSKYFHWWQQKSKKKKKNCGKK